MAQSGKIYFASDFHMGLQTGTPPIEREKRVVEWLRSVLPQAKEIYLLGDLFDFWYEYKTVVPKGFTRFLGTVSSITDSGIPVHFFTGNHDMWIKDYFSAECGMIIHTGPFTTNFNGKIFHLAHGEELGLTNRWYKFILSIFHNRLVRFLFGIIHPSIGVKLGHKWSYSSRLATGLSLEYLGEDNEDLIRYAREFLTHEKVDFFIFGHRHMVKRIRLDNSSEIIFLGDWIRNTCFAEWDGETLSLRSYPS